jgi:Rap1a immunity proteins
MKRPALLLIFLIGCFPFSAHADTGNEMQENCEIATRMPQDSLEGVKGAYCLGFVTAVLAVGRYLSGEDRFCAPAGISKGQAVSVFVKYLKENPAISHLRAEALVAASFKEAWPCK